MSESAQGKVVRLSVPIAGGESVTVAARLVMQGGAAVELVLPPPGAAVLDPRERAARALVQAIAGQMRRADRPGLYRLLQEAELMAQLLEQLVDVEAVAGRERAA